MVSTWAGDEAGTGDCTEELTENPCVIVGKGMDSRTRLPSLNPSWATQKLGGAGQVT